MHKCTELNMLHYADDRVVYVNGDILESMVPLANLELEKISSCLYVNNLSLKVGKSFLTVFFSSKALSYYNRMFIWGKLFPFENKTKLFGIIINNKLNFSDHIGEVCTKVRHFVGTMKNFLFSYKNLFYDHCFIALYFLTYFFPLRHEVIHSLVDLIDFLINIWKKW